MKALVSSFVDNRNLISQFVKRETIARYKGSLLGMFWSILTPILILTVYTFVFSAIFKARWSTGTGSNIEFALIAYCGLATFYIFSDVVQRAPTVILSNANYVKKVVFPLEIFAYISVGSALVNGAINYTLLIVAQALFIQDFHWTTVFLPIVLLPMLLMITGLSWILSSIGVFLRDIGHFIGIFIQALMLLSPIFYSKDVVPKQFEWLYALNPISYYVDSLRQIIIWGEIPGLMSFISQLAFGLIVFITGWLWFRKIKNSFADVL